MDLTSVRLRMNYFVLPKTRSGLVALYAGASPKRTLALRRPPAGSDGCRSSYQLPERRLVWLLRRDQRGDP